MRFLTSNELIEINKRIIKYAGEGSSGVQYPQGLNLIIEQPKQIIFGTELYPTLWLKAAFIMQKITKKHIFVDGNKRTAIMTTMIFIHINGYELDFEEKEAEKIILSVTVNNDSEETMIKLATWLEDHSSKH